MNYLPCRAVMLPLSEKKKKKYFFGDRSGVVNSVFQLAFVSLCRRRKKVLKGAFFVLSFLIVPPSSFFFDPK